MNEQHGNFTAANLIKRTRFAKAVPELHFGRKRHRRDKHTHCAAIQIFDSGFGLIPHRGVATVFNGELHLRRQLLARRHHDGGSAHGFAVEKDMRVFVAANNLVDPADDILTLRPAHANPVSGAVTVGASVRH